ncbi:MAG: hypothetical protein QN198_05675 [Armatimonadota bacterium]|nr:hypothetical protein [Armatimonadota bacterium]MDR5703077.1 hypothetical protein [Armatimonadota bacterium]
MLRHNLLVILEGLPRGRFARRKVVEGADQVVSQEAVELALKGALRFAGLEVLREAGRGD